jgi:hypothetical protein
MATISANRARINKRIAGYVTEDLVGEIAARLGYQFRRRALPPALTIQLMLLQVLAQVSLRCLRHVAQVTVSAQALCKAKARIPLQLLVELGERLCAGACDSPAEELWHGLRVMLGDAASILVEDTPELAKRYGSYQGKRQRRYGYPAPKAVALMDWSSGLIRKLILIPYARQELSCFVRMLKHLGEGTVVLLDRAYGSYGHVALALARGGQVCIRLQRCMVVSGKGSGNHRRIRRLARQDLLVRWRKGHRPTTFNRRRWEALPEELQLRQIAYRLVRKGFRTQWAWIITSLTDERRYPTQEIVSLYDRRWQVEVCFRDLKISLSMKKLRGRRIAAVRKEAICCVLLYNLVRLAMRQHARTTGTTTLRVSFRETLFWLLWSGDELLMRQITINPRRYRRSEPRRIKNHRRRYPRLHRPRQQLQTPPYHALVYSLS